MKRCSMIAFSMDRSSDGRDCEVHVKRSDGVERYSDNIKSPRNLICDSSNMLFHTWINLLQPKHTEETLTRDAIYGVFINMNVVHM